MPDIHIHRPHQLGLSAARSVAHTWARKAEAKFGLACVYEEGAEQDTLHFHRAGVQGTLQVQADQFDLTAELGFLFGAFQGRIEAEIAAQLDKLLGAAHPDGGADTAVALAPEPSESQAAPDTIAPKMAVSTKASAKRKPASKNRPA